MHRVNYLQPGEYHEPLQESLAGTAKSFKKLIKVLYKNSDSLTLGVGLAVKSERTTVVWGLVSEPRLRWVAFCEPGSQLALSLSEETRSATACSCKIYHASLRW